MLKEYLECGKIVGTHGVHGEVRVNPWCDSIEFLTQFKTFYLDDKGNKKISAISCRPNKNVAIIKIRGVDTIEMAEIYRNQVIYIKRKDAKIENGSYFITDLLGCKVVDFNNNSLEYGVINDVFKTGANDVWSIKKDNKEYLIPVIKDVVKRVDLENEIIEIQPLEGIFDDEN